MSALLFAIAQLIHSVISLHIWHYYNFGHTIICQPDPRNPIGDLLNRLTQPAWIWGQKKDAIREFFLG